MRRTLDITGDGDFPFFTDLVSRDHLDGPIRAENRDRMLALVSLENPGCAVAINARGDMVGVRNGGACPFYPVLGMTKTGEWSWIGYDVTIQGRPWIDQSEWLLIGD